jgi:hypothetical protein
LFIFNLLSDTLLKNSRDRDWRLIMAVNHEESKIRAIFKMLQKETHRDRDRDRDSGRDRDRDRDREVSLFVATSLKRVQRFFLSLRSVCKNINKFYQKAKTEKTGKY